MIRDILQLGDERLTRRSVEIVAEDLPSMSRIWQDLEDTLEATMNGHTFRNAAALSAVQIGVLKRACLIWLPNGGLIHIVNPTLPGLIGYLRELSISFLRVRQLVKRPGPLETILTHVSNLIAIPFKTFEVVEFEGCLSFFDKRGRVSRLRRIFVTFLDKNFQMRKAQFTGWGARILLHELDHMDGILYTDRMKSEEALVDYEEYYNRFVMPASR